MKNRHLLMSLLALTISSCSTTNNQSSNPSTAEPSAPVSEASVESLEKESELPSQEESIPSIPSEEPVSIESSDVSEEPVQSVIDESKYEAHVFADIEDIYLNENEVYSIGEMIDYGSKSPVSSLLNPATVITDIPEFVDVKIEDDTIKLQAKDLAGNDIVSGHVYIYNDTQLQKVNLSVVNYDEYGSYFMSVDLARLYKKKVMFFGDSITHSWLRCPSGNRPETQEEINQWNMFPDGYGYNTHYLSLLKTPCQFTSFVNAAWSGGTMAYLPKSAERFTYKSFPGAIEEHADEIQETEYIFVLYGTNDLSDQVPIGKMSDNVVIGGNVNSTFMGGMNYSINRIRELNPTVNIVFMNLLPRTYSYTGSITLQDYNDAISEVATSFAIKVLDVNSLFPLSESATYLKDGLHLSDAGNKLLADYILTGKTKYENN